MHPLVVPLRHAFLDDQGRGILHFDQYPCDLERWARDHGAAAEQETPGTVRALILAMIQSVAYIHSLGVIHGDLKPSNWLFDAATKLPLLCDFETAKDRGPTGATTVCGHATTAPGRDLQTRAYSAPELVRDPLRRKNRASDMYALGRSIQELAQRVFPRGLPPGHPLIVVFGKMLCEDPGERITAQLAQHDEIFRATGPCINVPAVSLEPPHYWVNKAPYHWYRTEEMESVIRTQLEKTTCNNCKYYDKQMKVRIRKVDRVENIIPWQSYAARRLELVERSNTSGKTRDSRSLVSREIEVADSQLDDISNEVYLWHGLPAGNVPMVAYSGLDERIANCKGLYGAGIYLTDQWCKALQYARAGKCSIRHKVCQGYYRCSCPGPKRVLLCRVLLGEAYEVKRNDDLKGQRRPPERPDAGPGAVYDSIIAKQGFINGRQQHHREFVLFDRKSVYPEWIIELDW